MSAVRPPQTLFISDLHLPTQPSPLRETFLHFLKTEARQAEALYILGDLFEYWIGDDQGIADYGEEIAALRDLTYAGVPAYYMHGNRDFLVGKKFAETTGVTLLADPHRVGLYGVQTLVSHGDIYCTDDADYQRWRRISHNRAVKGLYLMLPIALRQRIAGRIRAQSTEQNRYKPDDIMDVNADAVRTTFIQHDATRLIHGHTHRPATHRSRVKGQDRVRIVLADWTTERREALSVSPEGLHRIPLAV